MNNRLRILITGASSGFGRQTAQRLHQAGHHVFGTSRHPEKYADLDFDMLPLDVQDDNSVTTCLDLLLQHTDGLDVLINNAGYALNGFLEECSLTEAENIFQTNVFGPARLINAVLPLMRRQQHGRIINISSLAGLCGVPYHGYYAATKHALEGYTETLYYELRPFHIRVSLIEPGFFRTNLENAAPAAQNKLPAYDAVRGFLQKHFEEGVRKGGDPDDVARLIVHVVHTDKPRLRYRVGSDAVWLPRIKTLLGERLFTKGVLRYFRLKRASEN